MFRLTIHDTFLWTDSSVVLSWIRGDSERWTTFVFNRVHFILSFTRIEQWHHIESKENPADCNSRGLTVTQLRDSTLWWRGPSFLSSPQSQWPISKFDIVADDNKELRSKCKLVNATVNEPSRIETIMNRFSNFNRLRRALAYAIRFVHNAQRSSKLKLSKTTRSQSISLNEFIDRVAPLTVDEIHNSENCIIRWVQSIEFAAELRSIRQERATKKSSKL